MPGNDGQPAQDIPGWRLWVSSTGRHWAIRCGIPEKKRSRRYFLAAVTHSIAMFRQVRSPENINDNKQRTAGKAIAARLNADPTVPRRATAKVWTVPSVGGILAKSATGAWAA